MREAKHVQSMLKHAAHHEGGHEEHCNAHSRSEWQHLGSFTAMLTAGLNGNTLEALKPADLTSQHLKAFSSKDMHDRFCDVAAKPGTSCFLCSCLLTVELPLEQQACSNMQPLHQAALQAHTTCLHSLQKGFGHPKYFILVPMSIKQSRSDLACFVLLKV